MAQEEMTRVMEKNSAVGLAIAVVKGGEIIYTQSFGYKSLEDSTLLAEGDVFRIASISKSNIPLQFSFQTKSSIQKVS